MAGPYVSLVQLWVILPIACLFMNSIHADIYMHVPRGSNNRLNQAGRDRGTERLFDSQNNARGGYNKGTDGSMQYYQGSKLKIEWTNQHSCSDPNNHCELVIQYMCGPQVRDGLIANNIPDWDRSCLNRNCDTDTRFGMHERIDHYLRCKSRKRNDQLFTADQRLNGYSARYTRQNRGGNRRGLECPEERDHYPYWHDSPWRDIVVLTDNIDRCGYYARESQNVKDRWECVVPKDKMYQIIQRRKVLPNNEIECKALGQHAEWKKMPKHNIPPPECKKAPWSRDNHNGNGMGGEANSYDWTIPYNMEGSCVLRMRYNISTEDFDPWKTDHRANGYNPTKIDIGEKVGLSCHAGRERGYVYKNDPELQVVPGNLGRKMKLRLAINTAQFARTFQDRSHRFFVNKRPNYLKDKTIHNVNVRGKRGNIVQVYPAVEYDFAPNTVTAKQGDYVHFQWTGSNTNPRNNAGQGRAGTDRSNVVMLAPAVYAEKSTVATYPYGKFGHWGRSYPMHMYNTYFLDQSIGDLKDLAFVDPGAVSRKKYCHHNRGNAAELDYAPAYFDHSPRKVTTPGTYHYFCTRNNNFSNRSQKGKIIVKRVNTAEDAVEDNPKEDPCSSDEKSAEKDAEQTEQSKIVQQDFNQMLQNLPDSEEPNTEKSDSENKSDQQSSSEKSMLDSSNSATKLEEALEQNLEGAKEAVGPSQERSWDQAVADTANNDNGMFKSSK